MTSQSTMKHLNSSVITLTTGIMPSCSVGTTGHCGQWIDRLPGRLHPRLPRERREAPGGQRNDSSMQHGRGIGWCCHDALQHLLVIVYIV